MGKPFGDDNKEMVKPYEIFPQRISHHAVAEQLAASTLSYPDIQSKAHEVLTLGALFQKPQ